MGVGGGGGIQLPEFKVIHCYLSKVTSILSMLDVFC